MSMANNFGNNIYIYIYIIRRIYRPKDSINQINCPQGVPDLENITAPKI